METSASFEARSAPLPHPADGKRDGALRSAPASLLLLRLELHDSFVMATISSQPTSISALLRRTGQSKRTSEE